MNDKFNNQKETLVSLSHEINLLQQQVKYLLRNGKAAELLDLDVLMNRTHTIYDMICSISVGENDEEQDFDIDPEALTALFGGMGEDDEVMSDEVMGEEVIDEEDAAASRHCEEERRSNPEEEIEENTDEKFEEENIEEEVPETDEIQEPEEEPVIDDIPEIEEEGHFDYAQQPEEEEEVQQPEEEEEVQQSEEEKEPIAEEEKQQESDEFGLFFRFEDIPLREGKVESEEVESGKFLSEEVESGEGRFDSAQRPEEEEDQQFEEEITNDEKRFDSAQRPEEEEVIEEEQHLGYERTPDMVWDFGPSGEVESEEVESGELESGKVESEKVESVEVESVEVESEVVEEIDGKTVHFIEEVSIDKIPEKDRVEGDNLITDNPFEMPAMEDGSPSYGSYFEKDDMGFEISSNETLGESMIDDDNSLNAKYQHTPVNDLKTAIGLNDKFLLVNELFGGSMEKYTKSIDNLNDLKTLNGAMIYLNELKVELQWNSSNEAYKKLWTLVAQKFEGQ